MEGKYKMLENNSQQSVVMFPTRQKKKEEKGKPRTYTHLAKQSLSYVFPSIPHTGRNMYGQAQSPAKK